MTSAPEPGQVQDAVQRVLAARKYRHVEPGLVHELAARELARGRRLELQQDLVLAGE